MKKKIIILGANADIGFNIASMYADDGFEVVGTYRKENENSISLRKRSNVSLFQLDVFNKSDTPNFLAFLKNNHFEWTGIFDSIGSSEPIGGFFDTPFEEWEKSVTLNFSSQMRLIHALYELRDRSALVSINLMAGGGVNNAMKNYSAYNVSKLALIKMCEIIHEEYEDVKIQIIGPGYVRTKTHLETLKAGEKAGMAYEVVKAFLASDDPGTSFEDIYKCLRWIDESDKATTSGRNFSVVHDSWGSVPLEKALKASPDMYKMRRHGNNYLK